MKELRLVICLFAVNALQAQTPATAPVPQGSATPGAPVTPVQVSQPGNQPGTPGQAAVASSVLCAIKLPDPQHQPGSTAEWLKLADTCKNSTDENSGQNPTAGLKDKLFLAVSTSNGKLISADKTEIKPEVLKLMINGVQIDDATPFWEGGDGNTAILSTQLQRTDLSKAAWNQLIAQKLGKHSVPVTLADGSKKPLDSLARIDLQVVKFAWYTWIVLAIIVVLAIVLLTNDRLKDMLRDDGPFKDPGTPGAKASYSLSRVQTFYWFGIILVCYVVIWLLTGERDTINSDVLALMGISAGTLLGSATIDASKKSQAQSQLPAAVGALTQTQTVAVVTTAAAATAATSSTAPAALAASQAAVAQVATQAAASQQQAVVQLTDRTLADYHVSFLSDILNDEDGVSFHRFQIFAWALVLGVIFVISAFQTLGMPTFGNGLLGLMGISGGTYLGFKFPEQKTQ